MRDAVHLTLQEECFPQPYQAALGASVLPCLVPPFEFKPFLSFRAFSGQDSPVRSALSGHRYSTTAPAVHSGMQYGLP